MSCSSEPPTHVSLESEDPCQEGTIERHCEDSQAATTDPPERTGFSARRSEVLRYVFPRPSSRAAPAGASKPSHDQLAEHEHRKMLRSALRQAKPRVALHRVMTSIFNHTPTRNVPKPGASPLRSRSSSGGSKGPPNSVYSLEVVSPGTFLFSGPSLRSVYSGSLTNSTSHLARLTGNGSDGQSLRRLHSASLSFDNLSLFDNGVLEPYVERGITRSMSDVLLGRETPFDEIEDPL